MAPPPDPSSAPRARSGSAPAGVPPRPGRRARRARRAGALVLAVAALASCVSSTPTGQEVRSKADRAPADKGLLDGTVAATNTFGADLYRALAGGRGNFVYSPLALETALGMTRAGSGTAGTTRAELDALLHAPLTADLDAGLNTVQQSLQSRSGDKRSNTRKGKVSLELAESLWGQRGTHFKEEYLDRLATQYGAGFHVVDYRSDPESSRQAVNKWSVDATNGRYEELVSRGDVTQYTRFLVAAESYLQAPWLVPFDAKQTRLLPFQRLDDQPIQARTMQLSAASGLRFADKADWTAVELPYLGDELSLVIVQPAAGQFDAFEQAFTNSTIQDIGAALQPRAVTLRVPQFQFTTATNLNDALKQTAPSAFGTDADFSGITADETLAITDVVYKGFYGINEEGTDAANTATAAPTDDTTGMAGARSVTIDQPFLFYVRDRQTGVVLLLGRVVNPA